MGSHPWKSVTTYSSDPAAALARAQKEVFERGEYGFLHKMKPLLEAFAAAGKEPPPLPPEPKAGSIDEAREIAAESGTCSVLDVVKLGKKPGPGVAGPLSARVLEAAVGADRPTLAQAESGLVALYQRLGRGQATYIVCYENDQPAYYLVIGMSYD